MIDLNHFPHIYIRRQGTGPARAEESTSLIPAARSFLTTSDPCLPLGQLSRRTLIRLFSMVPHIDSSFTAKGCDP
jgi:hypothetical protein